MSTTPEPENLFWELIASHLDLPKPVNIRIGDKIGIEGQKQAFEAAMEAAVKAMTEHEFKRMILGEWKGKPEMSQPSGSTPRGDDTPLPMAPEPSSPMSKMDQVIEKWEKIVGKKPNKKTPAPETPTPRRVKPELEGKILKQVEATEKLLAEDSNLPCYMLVRGPGNFKLDGYFRKCTPMILASVRGMINDGELMTVEFMSITTVIPQHSGAALRRLDSLENDLGYEPFYYLAKFDKVRDPLKGGWVNICQYSPIPVK